MTPQQKTLVQTSFAQVAPIADTAADLFYGRLFELNASLRPLFKDDMSEQKKALMQMITVAVRGLDNLDTLVPAVQALGRRHARYGVRTEDYETVGAALLWTLEKGLGDGFTPEVRDSWASVYGILSNTMQTAAQEPGKN